MKKLFKIFTTLVVCLTVLTGCGSDSETASNYEGTLSDAINAIYEVKAPEFMVGEYPSDITDADNVKFLTGLDSAELISDMVISESMIGSQAYSLAMVRLNDSKDAQTVAQQMLEGIDTRKWICVEADDIQVVASGDIVMLIMIASEYSDMMTSQDVVDAFKEVVGSLSVEL